MQKKIRWRYGFKPMLHIFIERGWCETMHRLLDCDKVAVCVAFAILGNKEEPEQMRAGTPRASQDLAATHYKRPTVLTCCSEKETGDQTGG